MLGALKNMVLSRLGGATGGGAAKDAGALASAFDRVETDLLSDAAGRAESAVAAVATKAEGRIAGAEKAVEFASRRAVARAAQDAAALEKRIGGTGMAMADAPTSPLQKYRALTLALKAPGAGPEAGPEAGPGAGPITAPGAPGAGTPPVMPGGDDSSDTSAMNDETVQSVQFGNREVTAYAPTVIVTPPDQMIGQAAGLAAQSAAAYFDGMTKLVMASQSVILRKLTEDIASGNEASAVEDGLAIAGTELLLAGAMAVAAAGGAMEAASAGFAIKQITESIASRTGR
ncbi:hypothetical protein OU426_17475 [Frigidibacter sp. RF13]|uniref:hypothetical protein n=1 Tax=Frigidibacter sp. RF13 TaxID=2997340 RepID=UPI00226D72EC|nr:hypothetical protein [Frigidibacter sp. RF13]MCY1128652.1 hypothetical protein [Frigidibacter sp. RF13]